MRKLLTIMLLALGCFGAAQDSRAQACPGVAPWVFDDVLASDTFCSYITWMAQEGVSLGCIIIDANHRLYCPDNNVTRKQMSAFMFRLGDALFPSTCAVGQVMKWDGLQWGCAADIAGGGTVTSITAGTGLTGGVITGSGTLAADTTYLQRRVTGTCAAGSSVRVIAADGTVTCETDDVGTGTVTSVGSGTGLTGGPITTTGTLAADTTYLQRRVSSTCAVGSSIRVIAADGTVTCQTDNGGPANAYVQSGNAFGATAILGTTDNFALDVRANGARVMRYEPNAISPNVIGGSPANNVTAGVRGATIGGGGVPGGNTDPDFSGEAPNAVTDSYGTVGGGYGNRAGDAAGSTTDKGYATVGGGSGNVASHAGSTVGGGGSNIASGAVSTVGGGTQNTASGFIGTVGGGAGNVASGPNSTVAGGQANLASGDFSTVASGFNNTASGNSSTIAGGSNNVASGAGSTVAGGTSNSATAVYAFAAGSSNDANGAYSVAMGRRSIVTGAGSFTFADSNDFDFTTNIDNMFRVRATGGARFIVDIDGTGASTWFCAISAGNSWSCSSDRNLKQGLVALDGRAVLEKLVAMPVYQWQPKGKNAHVKHYGPMAQDFMAAFGLGDDDKVIGFQDADGVALAAIQGLNAKLAEQAREIAELRQAVNLLLARLGANERLAAMTP